MVINRADSPEFPDTIKEVIHAEGQYANANTDYFKNLTPFEPCVEAAARLLSGERVLNEPSVVFQSGGVQGSGVYLELYSSYYGYTDIDGLIEYHDSEYILLEVKHKDARVPYGQRLAIQRMVDDFTKAGKKAVAIVCEHKVDDTDKPVVAAFCKVRELYYGGEHKWRPPDSPMNVRQAIDKFRKYAKQHKGG